MKNIFKLSRILLVCIAVASSLQSCLKENTDDCLENQPNVRIVVRTLIETRAAGGSYNIENVAIYIFDDHKRFVGLWNGDAYIYGTEYVAELDIDPGLYHFVVWTNQGITYNKTIPTYGNDDVADDLIVTLTYYGGQVTEDIPDLHHGMITDAEVIANLTNEFTVVLRPNTYTLNFTVEGLPATGDDYIFTVTDNNSHYAFDNTIIDGQQFFDYVRRARFTNNKIAASMNTLRLTSDRNPAFDFSNATTDESLYADGLADMIKKAYNANGREPDFDTEFEFDIKISFRGMLGVSISVNGWKYTPNEFDL